MAEALEISQSCLLSNTGEDNMCNYLKQKNPQNTTNVIKYHPCQGNKFEAAYPVCSQMPNVSW